jgi:hypothetical protein
MAIDTNTITHSLSGGTTVVYTDLFQLSEDNSMELVKLIEDLSSVPMGIPSNMVFTMEYSETPSQETLEILENYL